MPIERLLIANRGEIAIRISQAAAELGIATVGIFSADDEKSLHKDSCDHAIALSGRGVPAYLDMEQVVNIAIENACDAIHPGNGFISESTEFASYVEEAGIVFVGPTPETLALFGDKSAARRIAEKHQIPVIAGTKEATSLEQAIEFFEALPEAQGMMIKAIGGGGGRGMRVVLDRAELETAYERCQSEAAAAFGVGELYTEQLMNHAKHIEVQVVGDGQGNVIHLGERECSSQRRHQKIIETAPAYGVDDSTRHELHTAAVKLAKAEQYRSLGTFEFLVDCDQEDPAFAFIEANARLQVEHTVTEEVTGVDLVQTQLRLASGESMSEIGLPLNGELALNGYSNQSRVNMEQITATGEVKPAGGTMSIYEVPTGRGIRVDGYGYSGYTSSPNFDSLLCKLIVHSSSNDFSSAVKKSIKALDRFNIEGIKTNIPFLRAILNDDDFNQGLVTTRWVDEHVEELVQAANMAKPEPDTEARSDGFAGARVDSRDPLALFEHDRKVKETQQAEEPEEVEVPRGPDGSIGQLAPIQGTIVDVKVEEGDTVYVNQELVIMEAMKMEYVIAASASGIVRRVAVRKGDVIQEGHPLVFVEEVDVGDGEQQAQIELDLDEIRGDLQESIERHSWIYDEKRPKALERRARTGQQTARTNINQFCDEGSFIEYGPLVLAAQRRRRTEDWLRENTPADGLVCGVGTVNANLFPDQDARCVAVAYDYTVFAGTQGHKNHYKQDRMYELANRFRLPVILFSEGGGGRPGDTDGSGGVGIDTFTFTQWSKLSARVPLVGVNSGCCFAANTALWGCCDVIIATNKSTIAMGGPAMIEGGGLGIFTPEEVGPMSFQVPNGVVDIIVEDEEELIATAQNYISYFQGSVSQWEASRSA